MSYGHTPDGDGENRSSGTVYGSTGSRGAAQIPIEGPATGSTGGRSGGATSGSGSRGTTYGSGSSGRGTTYGAGGSGNTGTTYGSSARSGGTTYGSPTSGAGTTYGSPASGAGTTYGSSASGGTTYGSAGTTYSSRGTTYGGTAVGDRPAGIGPRSRAAAIEEDRLVPELGGQPPTGAPPGVKKAKRKKILIGIGIGTAACLVLGLAGGGVAYAATDVPDIPTVSQTTQINYADGTAMATFATENRVEVKKLSEVPKVVQNEVVAAEDEEYWENGGVSIRGTGRAIWGLVKGNESAGGGSTITQQYVRNALNLTRSRSYTRKVKEIILAQKLSSSMSKDEILRRYLNTIYFGRSAWGIQSAAKAYFGKNVKDLTAAEGAVLAAVIKDPTNFDPKNNVESAKGRWTYVMDAMVKNGFMSTADRAKQVYPSNNQQLMKYTTTGSGAWRSGSTGVLGYRIEQELLKIGFSEQDINTGGLTVTTTISSAAQTAAKNTSRKYMEGQDSRMGTAMVSVDPSSGAVKAYYGGEGGYGSLDLASVNSPHPAGSSFKPYVLAAGVTDGYSIDSLWDGTSGQTFPDRTTPLTNSDGESCGPQCSLTKSTVLSLNTVYWALTRAVSIKTVAKTAEAAGIKTLDGVAMETKIKQGINTGIGLGQYQVSVLDQASGYATLANYGVYHQPYFINEVKNADGSVAWDHASNAAPEVQAWTKDVGRDVSYVLEQVYNSNTKNKIGRQGAIKTGTQQYQNSTENSHAWMCGYTPQLATAVWVGSKTKDFALRDKVNGNIHVYGNGIPGSIWRDFMKEALKKQKVEDFDAPVHAGEKTGNAVSESPTPEPSDTPDANDGDGNNNGEQTFDANIDGSTDANGTTTDQNNNNTNNDDNNNNNNN